MTPEQRRLAHDLVIIPPAGARSISKDAFAKQFPEALEGDRLSVRFLASAYRDRSAEDIQCALIIGFAFHFSSEHEELLLRLALSDWHVSHEDVVTALDKIHATSDKAVDALYEVTRISLPYLAYDDSKALAVTAIWALGRVPATYADSKLKLLAGSENSILSDHARRQLKRR